MRTPTQRQVLTTVPDTVNQYLLKTHHDHGIKHQGGGLSAAKIARALLAGCAMADVALSVYPNEEALTAFVADTFRHAGQTAQA